MRPVCGQAGCEDEDGAALGKRLNPTAGSVELRKPSEATDNSYVQGSYANLQLLASSDACHPGDGVYPARMFLSARNHAPAEGRVSMEAQSLAAYARVKKAETMNAKNTEKVIIIPVLGEGNLVKNQRLQYRVPVMPSKVSDPHEYQEIRVLTLEDTCDQEPEHQHMLKPKSLVVVKEENQRDCDRPEKLREKLVLVKDSGCGAADGDCRLCTMEELPSVIREFEDRDCTLSQTNGFWASLPAHICTPNYRGSGYHYSSQSGARQDPKRPKAGFSLLPPAALQNNQVRSRNEPADLCERLDMQDGNARFLYELRHGRFDGFDTRETSLHSSSAASTNDSLQTVSSHTHLADPCLSRIAKVIRPSETRPLTTAAKAVSTMAANRKRLNLPAPLRKQKQRRLQDCSVLQGKVILLKSKDLSLNLGSSPCNRSKMVEQVHQGKVIRSDFETKVMDTYQRQRIERLKSVRGAVAQKFSLNLV